MNCLDLAQYVTDHEHALLLRTEHEVATTGELAAGTGVDCARTRGWAAMRAVDNAHAHGWHPSIVLIDLANDPAALRAGYAGPIRRAVVRSLHRDLLSDQQVETWKRAEAAGTLPWTADRNRILAMSIGATEAQTYSYVRRQGDRRVR